MPRTTKEVNNKKDKTLVSKNSSKLNKNSSKLVDSKLNSKSTTKSTSKKATTKKATISNNVASNKKTPSKKKTKSSIKTKDSKSINVLEYYDLPYRYNQTTIKILAQTPKTLFVYWDISDNDRQNYIEQFGSDFFEKTKPVLIIHNTTMNYSFEIEINDFANCWYFNINDEKCEYLVELGRRPKESSYTSMPNNYLHITSSNKIESPNGHILFEKKQNTVFFRNVKNNHTFSKNIANFEFIKYFGKAYNMHNMYKKIYKEEDEILNNNPTSTFK